MAISVDKHLWQEHAQAFERDFWASAVKRNFGGWVDFVRDDRESIRDKQQTVSRLIWSNFGFEPDSITGSCLDIGPGPTARCSSLGGEWDAIEPLANSYRQLKWAWMPYRYVYTQPAEKQVSQLVGAYDFVVSLNCIDHCYNAIDVLANVASYLKPQATAFISFDVDKELEEDDPTHPLAMTSEEAREIIAMAGLKIVHETSGHCYPMPDGTWLDSWGGGTAYHWLLERAPC